MEPQPFTLPARSMIELILGVLLLAAWTWLQFVLQPATGLIHIALAAGVVLMVRGIASRGDIARR
jgi:hypothetical protein